MKTYNLKEVNESSIFPTGINTTTYKIPVDENGNIPEYLNKDRVVSETQIIVFDTRQEYLDYIASQSNP